MTFLGSLASTGSLLKAIGAAAASVTGPANAAAEGIILNDVYRVVPKAFNNLEVAVAEFFKIGSAALQPGELLEAVNIAGKTFSPRPISRCRPNSAAQELARSGNPAAALAAGAAQANAVVTTATGIVTQAIDTVLTIISKLLCRTVDPEQQRPDPHLRPAGHRA